MERINYQRLPGGHRGWLSRDSLWSASDHLLLVQSNGLVERYRRYYFSDIQGFTVRPSPRGQWITSFTGVPALLFLGLTLLVWSLSSSGAWALFPGAMLPPLLVVLLVNWAKGPTCITVIHTAVSSVELSPLGREISAFRSLEIIQQKVEAAQGALEPDQLGLSAGSKGSPTAERKVAPLPAAVNVPGAGQATLAIEEANRKAASHPLWLWVLGGAELLHLAAGLTLLLMGGGPIRLALWIALLPLLFLAASLGMARGGKAARGPSILALAHLILVGLASYVAFISVSVLKNLEHPGAPPKLDWTTFDPSAPLVATALWGAAAGSLVIMVWSSLTALSLRKPT